MNYEKILNMYRSLKVRIEPNSGQRRSIDESLRYHCYVYNGLITACKLYHQKNGKLPSQFILNKTCTVIWHNSPYMHDVLYQNAMNETAKRVLQAFEKCEENRKKKEHEALKKGKEQVFCGLSCPRFKKPAKFGSFTNPLHTDAFKEKNGRRLLKLSKVNGLIRCYNQNTPLPGIPKTCTVRRTNCGTHTEYYASISCYDKNECRSGDVFIEYHKPRAVGVDIGVSRIAVLSDGTVFENDHMYSKLLKDIKEKHEKLSYMTPGTPGYRKAKSHLDHLYRKLTDRRRNNVETISRKIVDDYDIICIENLSIKGLRGISKNKRMTNAYDDASLGMLRRRIEDKAIEAGRILLSVDPRDTSQICSKCGTYVKKNLRVRIHKCPECGLKMDRDLNSAINILRRGLTGNPSPASRGESPSQTVQAQQIMSNASLGVVKGYINKLLVRSSITCDYHE